MAFDPAPPSIRINPDNNVQEAINYIESLGGGTVYFDPGEYLVANDLIVPSLVALVGDSEGGSVIDFNGQPYQIRSEGSDVYDTGSVTAVNRSATITGVGTTWTTDMIGLSILIGAVVYTILDVPNTTEITIDSFYEGPDASGLHYAIFNPVFSVLIDSLTIQNSIADTGAVYFGYVLASRQRDITVIGSNIGLYYTNSAACRISGFTIVACGTGIYAEYSAGWTFYDFFSALNTNEGMSLYNFSNCSIANFALTSNGGDGALIDSCTNFGFYDAAITSNGDNGVEFVNSNGIQLFSANIKLSTSDGIKSIDSDQMIYTQNVLQYNGGYGVNLDVDSASNIVSNNVFDTNITGTLNNLGISNKIKNNVGLPDALNTRTVSASETATIDDDVILVNNSGSATITLPTAVGNRGKLITIKKVSVVGNDVVIEPDGSETIDGSANATIYEENLSLDLVSDNSNWRVI